MLHYFIDVILNVTIYLVLQRYQVMARPAKILIFNGHPVMRPQFSIISALLTPVRSLVTTILRPIFSSSPLTCDIIPTRRFVCDILINACIACDSFVSSNESKPSSTNIESRRMPPALFCISSERPSASDNEAMKDSPPESVFASRSVPL